MPGDDYTIKRSLAPEYALSSSADNVPSPPVVYLQSVGLVEVPSKNAVGSRVSPMVSPLLNQAPTSAPRYQESPLGSLYVQANYPVSTPLTSYGDQGDPQDCTFDNIALPSIPPPSPNSGIRLPYEAEYPWDNGSASSFSRPPLVRGVTAGSAMGLASGAASGGYTAPLRAWPDHHRNISSRSAIPSPAIPSVPKPDPSSYLDHQNFSMPLRRTTNLDQFTGQPYLPPSKPIEIQPTSAKPYNLPHSFPVPPQPNPSAQVVNLRASASIPHSPYLPSPLPSEIDTYESSSGIGNSNLSTLATPFMISPHGVKPAHNYAKAHHETMMEGSPRATQPISAHYAGHYYAETQSRTSSAGLPRDCNVQMPCGWRSEDGSMCGAPVTCRDCALHYATAHDIRNLAAESLVLCCWCPLSANKKVMRHNLVRHLREVHLRCPRHKKKDA